MKKQLMTLAALAAIAAGCSNDDENMVPVVDELTGTPINVSTRVATLLESRAVAGIDSETDITGRFFLQIVNESSADYSYYARMMYDDATSSWKSYEYDMTNGLTELPMLWQNSTTPVKVTAIYQKGGSWTKEQYNSSINGTVNSDQSTESSYKQCDYLYMLEETVTPSAKGIEVKFRHLMSKVVLSIDTKTTETDNPVTDVKIGGTATRRPFTPSTGVWGDVSSDYVKEVTPCPDTYADGTATYAAILMPQEVAANGFYVSFKIGERAYKWTSADAVTLENGNQYTLNLTVPETVSDAGATAVKLSSVAITRWDDSTTNVIGGSENTADLVPETDTTE